MSTTGVPLIRYIKDYEKDGIERKKFQFNAAGGGRSDQHVAYATGESTEFLIQETFKPLEDVRGCLCCGRWSLGRTAQIYGINAGAT